MYRRGAVRSSPDPSYTTSLLAWLVYGDDPFMRSTVPKENMSLSGEECAQCPLTLSDNPGDNWTPPPVVSKTFFVWPLLNKF